jgi:metallophosphoesterase superfamily enzyme
MLHVEVRPGLWLNRERALYLERERTLVIADIHWGYAHSHRRVGNLLPLWGNEQTAERLRLLLAHYAPARMIWLGDSLHAPDASSFAEEFLGKLPPGVEAIILRGNHDRKWPRADRAEFRFGDYVFHHGDKVRPSEKGVTEIIGHIHPAFSWSDGAGSRVKVPVLVEETNRLILPAFSDWSSGADWNGKSENARNLWLISSQRIFPIPQTA